MITNYVKHALAWVAFSFLYMKGLSTALTLSIDGQDDPSLTWTLAYVSIYILLCAHLVLKYEKLAPLIASVVISLSAIWLFGHQITSLLAGYSLELNLAIGLLLPFLSWSITEFQRKVSASKAE